MRGGEEDKQPPVISRRARSSSACSAGTRARTRSKVLETSQSDPGVKNQRELVNFDAEYEDFKFLENYMEMVARRRLEAGGVSMTAESGGEEEELVGSSSRTSRETKINIFRTRFGMSKGKQSQKGRSVSESRRNSCRDQAASIFTNAKSSHDRAVQPDSSSSNSQSSFTLEPEISRTSSIGSRDQLGRLKTRALTDSIKKNIWKLEDLAREFEYLNLDLANNVEEEHKNLLLNESKTIPEEYIHQLGAFNLSAQSDIQRACLAFSNYMNIVQQIQEVMVSAGETKEELECPNRLQEGNSIVFLKVQAKAVERLKSYSAIDEDLYQSQAMAR